MEILCFFTGIVFFYSTSLYCLLFILIALLLKSRWPVLLWFAGGYGWCLVHQITMTDQNMPKEWVIPKAQITGQIISIPAVNEDKTQFQFLLETLNDRKVNATILLACYSHCPSFETGQHWRFEAKLKKPQNLANPGAFNYVGWLSAHHINWTGYIKAHAILLSEPKFRGVLIAREQLAARFAQLLSDDNTIGILQALTLGITNHLSQAQWELFRRTGTTHLMVISGSHIVLVAMIFFMLIKYFWSRSARLCLYYPAAQVASLGSWIAAVGYTIMAGFAVPAQRALVAYTFLLGANLCSYRFTVWQAWRYGLLLVLLYEPHAALFSGLYLSFLAVAILIAITQRFSCQGIKKAVLLQVACLAGLMPFTLYWFSYGAINGLAANLLAIPLVGYIIVPLSLASLIVIQFFNTPMLLLPVKWTIKGLLVFLTWIDSCSGINLQFSLIETSSLLGFIFSLGIFVFFPLKRVIPPLIIIMICACFPYHSRPPNGEAYIDVLDVGQGLAVAIQTQHHNLLYDTGMKFYNGNDMGKLAIIPYLKTLGITALDKVIISHPDVDHRGGFPSIEKEISVGKLIVNDVSFYKRGQSCHTYPAWQWDGVSFRFFPINQFFKEKNNSSCVLQISTQAGEFLLPGDIEKKAEDYLVNTYADALKSSILLVAHHGSKTSSSSSFIKYVAPKYAIISAGFDNRFHFPHPQTINTLKLNNSQIIDTIKCGMVHVQLPAAISEIKTSCFNHQ